MDETKKRPLTKCPACGCETFIVNEGSCYKAKVDDKTGKLETFTCYGNEIESIICFQCDNEVSEGDFEAVEFCD